MPSAPYMMVTPAIGTSPNGRYWVKFGDDSSDDSTRLQDYNTYNPPGNRTSGQLPGSIDYMVDGTMMKKQIFRAENGALGRVAFTRIGTGASEWFEVWPRNAVTGALDSAPLGALVAAFQLQGGAGGGRAGNQANFINWLHLQLPDTWRH